VLVIASAACDPPLELLELLLEPLLLLEEEDEPLLLEDELLELEFAP
jgi:hypothetical protein